MLNKSQMSKIQSLFIEASDEQMREIAKMFNDARSIKTARAARTFKVGQNVSWTSKSGAEKTGIVTKVNRKNVLVDTKHGQWRVTASLLKAA